MSDWLRAVDVLRRQWTWSALFALVVMVTVVVVTFSTKSVYEPVARIEIDPPGETFSLEGNGSGASDAEYLETQAQNLRSDNLAVEVIRQLRLDQNPELMGEAGAGKHKQANADATANSLQLTSAEGVALENFQNRLKIRRDTASRLILVSFASHDPRLAAQVTNAVVQTFIEDTFQTRHNSIMRSSEWLARQLDDLRTKMETSSRALAQFQGDIGVADVDENRSTYTEHMSELSRQQTQAQSERIQVEALLKNMQNGNPDSLPEVRSNPVVQQLSERLAERRAELAQALVVYGKNHPTAKKFQSEVDELQKQLDTQKKAIVSSLRASYAAAQARERLMGAEMKGTTQELSQMARYTALKKEVQTNVELYNSLYAKIKEAGIAAASKSGNIRIVDQARVLIYPTGPNRLLNLAVGLLIALVGAVATAFIREEFDNKLHSLEDMKRWIGSSSVCLIPVIGEAERHDPRLGWSKRIAGLLPAPAANENENDMFLLERPHSPEAEAVQSLHTSILFSRPGDPPQVLLVSSASPGEGKTTVAMNLSLALAKHGKTCLVDADLRNGRVARAFGLPSGQGLANVLADSAELESALREAHGMSNLLIVPAGAANGNSGELVCSDRMQHFVQALRQRFRFVVIDSAPILPFADGRALSTLADAVILVGRAGLTTRQAMRRSVELIEEVHGAPILQFVLNAAEFGSMDYKYQYGQYYHRPASD